MTREAIEDALKRKPFRPFALRLTSGQLVQIKKEHTAAVHPFAQTMIIFETKGGYRILDIPLIVELQTA